MYPRGVASRRKGLWLIGPPRARNHVLRNQHFAPTSVICCSLCVSVARHPHCAVRYTELAPTRFKNF
jgi:hypothetical protein